MATHADDPQRSIEEFIRERFNADEIMSVEVGDDREGGDTAVLDITVIFRGTPFDFARKEPPGFLSKLREYVEASHHAFPVVRFRPSLP